MALLTDPDELFQGAETAVADLRFGVQTTVSGNTISIDSAGGNLPALGDDDYFEVRGADDTNNNGLYRVADATPAVTAIDCNKITGANPTDSGTDNTGGSVLGSTGTPKNVFFDTQGLEVFLIEQNGMDADGVEMNAIYSSAKEEWKDDDFLKRFFFPMFAVDLDAGKYQIGTDGANPNGWKFAPDNVVDGTIRTKKLVRSGGWAEIDSAGIQQKVYASIITLGSFEDETPSTGDLAYFQFGSDFVVDDTVDFDFTGPVNEVVLCYDEIGNPATFTYVDGAGGDDTATRASGSFIDDGFKVGGKMVTRASTTAANDNADGYLIIGVAALTLTFATASFDTGEADPLVQVSVDNRDAFSVKLRVRDSDPNGKTFDSSDLAAAGVPKLNNFIFRFPLANQSDLKIDATDTNVENDAPYTSMTIDYGNPTTSQSGLVGGSFDFAITIDAATGTAQQVYEFVQHELRELTDIDANLTAIGRTVGDLLVFEGDVLVSGNQLSENPNAATPGTLRGVFIENIAASDQNNLRMVDDTGVRRQFPETISVTLDFNAALIDDSVAEYTLWFDRTIRNTVTDLVVTAGTGPVGTIDSAGAELPAAMDNDPNGYIRISGLTGPDAPMNGTYQVTVTTSTSQWAVERYDGATIVTTAGTDNPVEVDEHPIDSPDAIIVDDDSPAPVTGVASSDFNFAFDYDGNVQGGRVVSQPTFVVGRAIGLDGAQFVQSGVQTITSGTPLTIVLTASGELNYVNN